MKNKAKSQPLTQQTFISIAPSGQTNHSPFPPFSPLTPLTRGLLTPPWPLCY